MKLMTIIGTRPQYIKLKPIHDYCVENKIENIVVDTGQHYSPAVSADLIAELQLRIDYSLSHDNYSELPFIASAIIGLEKVIVEESPDFILLMGDTNSTLAGALVASKLGIKSGHIESGIRCGDKNNPEEKNRILVDGMTSVHFLSREIDSCNVDNPVYVGDLEYAFLNSIDIKEISYGENIVMTIHRRENINKASLQRIFRFCNEINREILFLVHHSVAPALKGVTLPSNIIPTKPVTYFKMIELLKDCGGVITDSGGVCKITPFFGKKCVVPLSFYTWGEIFEEGYGTNNLDSKWFDEKIKRNTDMYYCKNGIKRLVSGIMDKLW